MLSSPAVLPHSRSVTSFVRLTLLLFALEAHCIQAVAADKRLAVMPGDNTPELGSLAELLTAALSSQTGIALVERADIERVLKEQSLNAAGLTDAAKRIAVGKFLGADAYVFVQKTARAGDLRLKLVEAQEGLLVWQALVPPLDRKPDVLANDLARLILDHIAKLSVAPSVCP